MKILGFGHHVSGRHVTNHDLMEIVDTSDEWIYDRTGIKARYIADCNTSDLAYGAALKAIGATNVDEIDLIIVATFSPDQLTPSVASLVQKKLGAKSATAFDLNAACTGFIYALATAEALIKTGGYKKALVIGAETISKTLDWEDRTTCVLFGDGAGAVLIGDGDPIISYTESRIDVDDVLYAKGIRMINPFYDDSNEEQKLRMNGQSVFKFAVGAMSRAIKEVTRASGVSLDEIDYIVPHQANKRIVEFVSKQLRIPIEKFYMNIEEYGNTSAASIPIALSEMKGKGLLSKPAKLIIVGFGAGLTSGASYIDYKN